ncbi:hypothetical protein Tco_0689590 [Tanacetum coccineum]
MQITHVAEEAANMPYDSPLLRGHTPGSDEGSMTLNELTVLCTQLSIKMASLEADLKQTKKEYGNAYTKLITKVKKLERKVKSSKSRRRAKIKISDDEDYQEDPSKQGRKIAQIDEYEGITLFTAPEEDYTAEPDISTANVPVSTAGPEKKDKSKAIMKEVEPVKKNTKLQLEQERLGLEEALRLQKQLDEEESLSMKERDEQRRNKLITQAQQRTYMCNYIKHIGIHTLQQLKKLSFDEIKELFEITMKRVELKRLLEPDTDDLLELQRCMHDPLTWRLYDTCGVNHVSTETGLDIFMPVEKDYPMTRGLLMLMLVNKLQVDQHSEMADELLRKIFILANRLRH